MRKSLTAMYLSKHLFPRLNTMIAKTFVNELCSFSLAMEVSEGKVVKRIYSNFNDTVMTIMTSFERILGALRAAG